MADPRVNLVKPCPPSYLGKSAAELGNSAASRRNFTNAANKIGNLEILNSVGAGQIGQGLRTLASISNSIRQGCGSLPTSIGGALGTVVDGAEAAFTAGTDWALNQMGLDIKTVDAVRAFQPGIANQALGQAQQIYNQVRQGGFKYTDIPGYLQDFQNLERLGRNIFTPGAFDRNDQLMPQCEASPYALDLIARAPKHKFMFVVQFVPKNGYESLQNLDAAFMVYESSRPDIRYQMEDINYYNFRSKIITKTEFEPMTMKFYDDNLNAVGKWHAAYLKAMTPVANYPSPGEFYSPETEGMDFTNNTAPPITGADFNARKYSASTNNLLNSNTTLLNEIVLYHLFDGGRVLNVYRFYNPRISNLKLDDLTMSESAVTALDLTFAYDTVYIATDVSFNGSNLARSAQAASAGIGGSALYSLKYIASPGAAAGPNNAGLLPGQPVKPRNTCSTDIQNNNPTSPPAASTPGGNTSASPAAQQDPFLASGPL